MNIEKKLTIEACHFPLLMSGKKNAVLRKDYVKEVVGWGRRKLSRPRPVVGDNLRIGVRGRPDTHLLTTVKEVATIAFYHGEEHPVWRNGEPIRHLEQEELAHELGYDSYSELEYWLYTRYGPTFEGYFVRW